MCKFFKKKCSGTFATNSNNELNMQVVVKRYYAVLQARLFCLLCAPPPLLLAKNESQDSFSIHFASQAFLDMLCDKVLCRPVINMLWTKLLICHIYAWLIDIFWFKNDEFLGHYLLLDMIYISLPRHPQQA